MKSCPACGFEPVPEGKACPLCQSGPTRATAVLGSLSTETVPLPARVDETAPRKSPSQSEKRGGPDYPAGHLYAGGLRIEALVGRGGMGSVYRVTDGEGRARALKVLHASAFDEDQPGPSRFKREVGILSKMNHPAVPRIFGWGTCGDELYLVCDLIEGETLKDEIRRRGPLPIPEAVEIAATLADALGAAHALSVIHRDVKPQNVMISAKDRAIKLVDFGIARSVGLDLRTITETDMVVGTPEYMSPEQLESHRVDERCDLYALGVVLFEMLTGRLPFTGDSALAVAMKHRNDPPPLPRTLRPEIPSWLERIVLRCLEKERAKRFLSAQDLERELRRPRTGARAPLRRLPTGDFVVEDQSESSPYALVLATAREKDGWSLGMTLQFESRYYRLDDVEAPGPSSPRYSYRFTAWPENDVFRKVVDYDTDAAERVEREAGSLGSKLKSLFGKR